MANQPGANFPDVLPWDVPYHDKLRFLYDTRFRSDVVVSLGQAREPERVHRIVMQMGSTVLDRMFRNTINIDFHDISLQAFQSLLRFLYLDEIQDDDGDLMNFDLIELATRFEIHRLTDRLEGVIENNLTLANVLRTFNYAWNNHKNRLAERCMAMIIPNAEELFRTQDIRSLSENSFMQILRQDRIMVESELQVYQTALEWAEAERQRRRSNDEAPRITLMRVLPLIRFSCMTAREFSIHVVRNNNILSADDCLRVYQQLTLPDDLLPVEAYRFPTAQRNYRKHVGAGNRSPNGADINFNIHRL